MFRDGSSHGRADATGILRAVKSPLAVGAVAAVVIALLTAGGVAALTVGGDDGTDAVPRLTEQEFEAQATAVCKKSFSALAEAGSSLPSDRSPTDEELTAFNDARQAIFATLLADLEALRPPQEDDDSADKLTELVARSGELDNAYITTYVELPEGQTESPELVAIQDEFAPVVDELKAVASRLGVVACAGG